MRKNLRFLPLCAFLLAPSLSTAAPSIEAAYQYGYSLFTANNFKESKQYYLYVVLNGQDAELKANSLYMLCQCYLRLGDYNNCVKAANMLAGGYPRSTVVKNGMLTTFATSLISQISNLQTDWDYWRYQDGTDDKDQPIWKESVPVGKPIKRIDFRLAFGLYRALEKINPASPQVAAAKKQLDGMLNRPLTIIWVDQKAAPNDQGHPADFFSLFTKKEKKKFSQVICERMFYDWKTDMLYRFMDMYDDVRNHNPQYTAKTFNLDEDNSSTSPLVAPAGSAAPPPPPGAPAPSTATVSANDSFNEPVLTLAKLFAAAAYNPYSDTFGNPAEISGAVAPSL
ncbi:MAG TPA: hypothetical protein VFR02_10045 [bacterium]|nr:hypothetical protein [bacterium]